MDFLFFFLTGGVLLLCSLWQQLEVKNVNATEHLPHQLLRFPRRKADVHAGHSHHLTTTGFSITFLSFGSSHWTTKALDIWQECSGPKGDHIAAPEYLY